MFEFFKAEFFNFEFVRLLGTAPYGGCEIGEALEAVAKIKDQDPESWYSAWLTAGVNAEKLASEAKDCGHVIAARRAYLRAANYFRAAQFMLNSRPGFHDDRVLPTFEKGIMNCQKGLELSDERVELLQIQQENDTLPGKFPLVINLGGGT